MEITTEINKEKNIRRHIVKGTIDRSEFIQSLKEIYNSSDFDPKMNALWDLQEADFSDVFSEDITAFIDSFDRKWGCGEEIKIALVVSSDLSYGMSRMFEIMRGNLTSNEIVVFRDINKAKEWIEVET